MGSRVGGGGKLIMSRSSSESSWSSVAGFGCSLRFKGNELLRCFGLRVAVVVVVVVIGACFVLRLVRAALKFALVDEKSGLVYVVVVVVVVVTIVVSGAVFEFGLALSGLVFL
jgi:hypothetical protein